MTKLLVCSRSEAECKSLSLILKDFFEVFVSGDYADCLEKIRQQAIRVLIVDIGKPDFETGLSFIKQVSSKNRKISLIALINDSKERTIDRLKKTDIDVWILKPYSADKVIGVLKKSIIP